MLGLVRMTLGWNLGGLRDRAAERALRELLGDPDEHVPNFAARGLARLDHLSARGRLEEGG
jgi:HEAT repeat protein